MKKSSEAQFDAILYHGIVYTYKVQGINRHGLRIIFDIKVDFVPTKSYFTFNNPESDELLLKHEQGHSDIATIFAQKLQRNLSSAKYHSTDYKHTMNKVYTSIIDSLASEHLLYDSETSHGTKLEAQEKWSVKLQAEIN